MKSVITAGLVALSTSVSACNVLKLTSSGLAYTDMTIEKALSHKGTNRVCSLYRWLEDGKV
jgi:hypothetical protein